LANLYISSNIPLGNIFYNDLLESLNIINYIDSLIDINNIIYINDIIYNEISVISYIGFIFIELSYLFNFFGQDLIEVGPLFMNEVGSSSSNSGQGNSNNSGMGNTGDNQGDDDDDNNRRSKRPRSDYNENDHTSKRPRLESKSTITVGEWKSMSGQPLSSEAQLYAEGKNLDPITQKIQETQNQRALDMQHQSALRLQALEEKRLIEAMEARQWFERQTVLQEVIENNAKSHEALHAFKDIEEFAKALPEGKYHNYNDRQPRFGTLTQNNPEHEVIKKLLNSEKILNDPDMSIKDKLCKAMQQFGLLHISDKDLTKITDEQANLFKDRLMKSVELATSNPVTQDNIDYVRNNDNLDEYEKMNVYIRRHFHKALERIYTDINQVRSITRDRDVDY
jgi:hypothetical protein